jgi:hypothetical protein
LGSFCGAGPTNHFLFYSSRPPRHLGSPDRARHDTLTGGTRWTATLTDTITRDRITNAWGPRVRTPLPFLLQQTPPYATASWTSTPEIPAARRPSRPESGSLGYTSHAFASLYSPAPLRPRQPSYQSRHCHRPCVSATPHNRGHRITYSVRDASIQLAVGVPVLAARD